MKVIVSHTARGNLRAIRDYYAETSPAYARRVIENIYRRLQQLSRFPESGAVLEEYAIPQIRQVIEGRYRIIYRIAADGIEVLAVRHGSQAWPDN